jgi:hypothetical protein
MRFTLAGVLLTVSLTVSFALAQTAGRKAAIEAKPATFGESIRSRDRLAPTPQYSALAPELFARKIVETASPHGDYGVEVWSLLVGPHASTGEAKLSGAAVLLLQTGHVELIIGDRKRRLEPGSTATVPEGATLRFVNADDSRPAHLRAVVLSGSR